MVLESGEFKIEGLAFVRAFLFCHLTVEGQREGKRESGKRGLNSYAVKNSFPQYCL
jgi:hypothetical protein